MASPFTVFRKNQKVLLAITGILAMIAFVFLGTCIQNTGPALARQNPTVVSWKYGDITQFEMDERMAMRRILNQFIAGAMSLAGQQRPMSAIFPESEEEIVRSMVLARRGRELGLVISDEMVNRVLEQLTSNRVRPADLEAIAANYRLGGQRVTPKQIFDALREELLASRVNMLFLQGLGVAGDQFMPPLDTPGQRWDYFRRLERRATVQVLPVPVAEFTEDVGKPSEEELVDLFEKHRSQFPSPDSPDPGFRQPYQARFEYFKAGVEDLVTAEMERISDEAVREYYEKNKAALFRKSTLSPIDDEDAKLDDLTTPDDAKPDGAKKDDGGVDAAKESDSKGPDNQSDSKESAAKEAKPSEGASDPQPSAPSKNADKSGETEAGDNSSDKSVKEGNGANAADASKSVDDKSPLPPADKATPADKSAHAGRESPFRLVRFQDEKGQANQAANQEAPVETKQDASTQDSVAQDATKQEAAKQEAKSDAKTVPDNNETKGSAPAGSAPVGSAPEVGGKDAAVDDTKKTAPDETPETAKDSDNADATSDSAELAPVEYRPLEQVEEEIRRTLAREKVQAEVDERMAKLRTEMTRYADQRKSWQILAVKNPDEPKPAPLDMEAISQKYGVKAFTTEMLSQLDAETSANLDIAKSRDLNNRSPNFFQTWTQIVFQPKGLYRPLLTRDPAAEASFLSWKTEESEGHIPEFKEVRGQVLEAWKRIKARDLAKKKAAQYASTVRKAELPMAEVFAQDKNLPVKEVGPFSWFTRPNVPFGMMQQLPPVVYSEVAGVENPREEFMETTFNLKPGEVGVALNHPKSVAYVIQAVSFDPLNAVLEQEFMVRMRDYERYRAAGNTQIAQAQNDWMESLLAEYGVDWRRPPDIQLASAE